MFSAVEVANLFTVIKLSYKLHTRCGSYAALFVDLFTLSFCHLSIFLKNINSVLSVWRRERESERGDVISPRNQVESIPPTAENILDSGYLFSY